MAGRSNDDLLAQLTATLTARQRTLTQYSAATSADWNDLFTEFGLRLGADERVRLKTRIMAELETGAARRPHKYTAEDSGTALISLLTQSCASLSLGLCLSVCLSLCLSLSSSRSLSLSVSLFLSLGLDDSPSSDDSFLGQAAATVLVLRADNSGLNGILVCINGRDSAKQYHVFTVAHGVVGRNRDDTMTVEHCNCRLLLLQPETDSLSLDDPNSFIVLPWTRCIHWGREYWGTNEKVARFISDCAVFEIPGNQLSDALRARAVTVFDWQGGSHQPSSKAVGVSLVRDEAERHVPRFTELRIEERLSGWATSYVYLPSEISAKGQSGTGLTDKKKRLVSIVSGNYEIGKKRCAVAILVKQHIQLLHQQSRAGSFVPAATELRTPVTLASSSTSSSRNTRSSSSGAEGGRKRPRPNS